MLPPFFANEFDFSIAPRPGVSPRALLLHGALFRDAKTRRLRLRAQTVPNGPAPVVDLPGQTLFGRGDAYSPPWGRRPAGFLRTKRGLVLWAMSETAGELNNWEYTTLTFFVRCGGRWTALAAPEPIAYSHRGGAQATSDGILLWDFTVDRGHGGPSRYRVRRFTIEGKRIVRRWERTTKGMYSPRAGATAWFSPSAVSAKDDPLREFGERWRFWPQDRR